MQLIYTISALISGIFFPIFKKSMGLRRSSDPIMSMFLGEFRPFIAGIFADLAGQIGIASAGFWADYGLAFVPCFRL